ncbi:DUF2247 family protein [Listeria booriae]|nr:DUF2247 family protein [Listeria booriae]
MISIKVTWDDIIFGLENKFLDSLSVSEYVYNYLLKNNVNTDMVKDKYLYVLLKLV